MQLWNDYEGSTIAGSFPLDRFLRPEGRSGIFSTHTISGVPADIRLTEALNDEQGILERWRTIAELKHPNLVAITQYGQTELDGTHLVYAVMEPTDMNLADILRDRPLTVEETRQIAVSLVSALQALHGRGLIHEQLEAASVLAAGEVVKLRSDCVRQAPQEDASELKARNVQALCVLLRQALTQQKSGTALLPVPFDGIVRNGMSGVWGLPQIAAALTPTRTPAAPAASSASAPSTQPSKAPAVKAAAPASSTAPYTARRVAPAESSFSGRSNRERQNQDNERARLRVWAAVVVAVLLVAFIGWHYLHTSTTSAPSQPPRPAQSVPAAVETPAKPAAAGPARNAMPRSTSANQATAADADSGAVWRVVVYTFNHPDQAQAKAESIAKQHADLRPQVFSSKGRAPYLVTLGGYMSREQAIALRGKAIAEGFPRDTYARNYTGKR